MVFEEVSFLFTKYVEEWLNRNTVNFIGAIVAQLTCVSLWLDWFESHEPVYSYS